MAVDETTGGPRRVALDGAALEQLIASIPLFARCDRTVYARVIPHVELTEVPPEAVVIRAGEPSRGAYVLCRGKASVRVVDSHTGESHLVETLRPGDHFGEVGALLRGVQPFAVTADEASLVLRVPVDVIDALSERVPGFGDVLARRLARRLLQSTLVGQGGAPRSVTLPPPSRSPSVPPSLGGPPSSAASLPPWVTPFVQVTDYEPSPQIVALIPARMIQQYRLLPLGLRGNVLTVGMVNPRDGAAIAELKRVLASVEISVAAIGLDDFAQAVVRMRVTAALDASRKGGGHLAPDAIVYDAVEVDREAEKAGGRVIGDDVVQIVNRIVVHALEREASDIHMEPDVAGVKIRFRVHGMLVDWNEVVPPAWAKGLVARVKVLAGLDITERRAPQDGRIGLKIGRREVDLRVSTMPATRGEKVVLRVLEAATMARPLEHVFLEPTTLQMVRRALHRPFGAIVVAGPTGAGKTTTLYATLGERRRTRPDTNVVTIEDPVEYRLAGVTQVQVRHDAGLGFAQVLRSTLRQDPDVIMVGEVRDEETAHLALEASMTGHLLLTSIHANTAFSVMQRLENLRCDRTHIAQALAMVVVQRLARKLCSQCAKVEPPTPVLVETLAARGLIDPSAPTPLPRAVGCDACGNTGFSGRVAVIEALHMTDDVRSALMAGHSFPDIQRAAAQAQLLVPFSRYAAFLMAQRLLAPSDALLTLAE